MIRSPAGQSGRPDRAAGLLVSVLLATVTTVGLGCAAAGTSTSSAAIALGQATDPPAVPGESTTSGRAALELRPTSETVRTPRTPAARARPRTGDASPPPSTSPPPVVDARLTSPASSRDAEPVRLRVDAADLDLPVRATGVAEDGSMQLPDTVRRAGWYRYSARAGSPVGSTVIAAHVDTRAEGLGPFARLSGLDRGDRIEITDRSVVDHRFRVEVIRRITRSSLPVERLFDRDGAPRLVLITCGGAYDARDGYHDNVVVLAEPEP